MSTKIIHLSDLHIEHEDCEHFKNFQTISSIVKTKYKENAKDTLILITGDIADGAEKQQFKAAKKIIDPLDQDDFTVWPLPGNHDYAPGGNIGNAKTAIRTGDMYHSYKFVYTDKFIEEFDKNILRFRKLPQIRKFQYPQILHEENSLIWFFGLNSTNIEEIDFKGGQGGIGKTQLDSLASELEKIKTEKPNDVVVVLLHHHAFKLDNVSDDIWHQLVNGDLLMQIMKNKVDILLFGHEHWHFYNKTGKINDDNSDIPHILSCASSTSQKGKFMKVDDEGVVHWKEPEFGFYGWEIDIENKVNIKINMLNFDLQERDIIKTQLS